MKRAAIISTSISLAFFMFAAAGVSFAADKALIEAAKKEGAVVWYTAFARRYIPPIAELFKKKYGLGDDFKVIVTRKGSGAIGQMIDAEHMTGNSKWDVESIGDAATTLRWLKEGLLMKYQPPNIGNVRKEFLDPYGYRVTGQIGITSIAVNSARVPEKDWPKSFEDVLDPKWKGRVALCDPATCGPGITNVKFLVDLYGWDYFRKLGKNRPIITKGNSAGEQLLLSGEADVALTPNEYSILARIHKGEKNLKVIYPEKTAYYPMWLSINKDAPHPNAAKLWMEFTVSDEREKFVMVNSGRYITSKNVEFTTPRPPLNFHQLDWEAIMKNKNAMSKKFLAEIAKGKSGE